MRLWARTLSKLTVTDMANNMGNPIADVSKNERLTLVEYKKNAGVGYYFTTEYNGWVPGHSIKIERDIEFLYTSSLKNKLLSRSKNMRMMANGDTAPNNINRSAVSQFSAESQNSNETVDDKTDKNGKEEGKKKSDNKWGKLAANVGSHYINNTAVTNVANTFIADGDWKAEMNNTSINQLLGIDSGSLVGQILGGATIGNVGSGEFFLKGLFEREGLLNNLYILALNKLSYVIGTKFGSNWGWLLNSVGNLFFGTSAFGSISSDIKFPQMQYAPITMDMVKYFRYKGCDYRMITRTFDTLWKWKQDESYATPTLVPKQIPEEVRFHREIYNNMYSDYSDAISKAKYNLNLEISRKDWFVNFNRYRLCHPDSELIGSVPYVFFTRPDLNLSEKLSGISLSALAPFLYNMMKQHPTLTYSLTKRYSGQHSFLPLLCNKARTIDIQDEQIKTREVGETLTGYKIAYAFHNIESITANTVSISFVDDEQLSVYLLFKIWEEYMAGVSRGILYPRQTYIRTKQLDYAISIYYFLCAPDGESILFWSKFTGAFPTNIPSSNFSMSDGDKVKHPVHSITWQYAEKRDYNPLHLAEFNQLSDSNYQYIKPYSPDLFRTAPTLQGAPFVDTNTGGKLFKLRFRQRIE